MDLAVTQYLNGSTGGWQLDPPLSSLTAVLHAVVLHDQRLDRKYNHFDVTLELLKKHPSLKFKVDEAWKKGSYCDIRKLEILQAPVQAPSGCILQIQLDALQKGLTATYRGQAVDAFYNYLQENDMAFEESKEEKYYGKFCSIVQSSGTGKTRLMLELAMKGVCVLYMNLREADDKTGYPARDSIPADILSYPCTTEHEYNIQCFAFFAAIFKSLHTFLDKQLNWCKDMCAIGSHIRTSFFMNLQQEYNKLKEEIHDLSTGAKTMRKYYWMLVSSQGFPQAKKNEPTVVIALDEAHVLHTLMGTNEKEQFSPAKVLLHTIKEYSEYNKKYAIWVVFASTTSKVGDFAAPQTQFPSARVSVKGELVFPPFTQLGWDQYAPSLKEILPHEVTKAKHILQYGRPLWVPLMEGYSLDSLIELAGVKLCQSTVFTPEDNHQAFAVLAQRFGLDVAFGHREAVCYVESSIASHLHICLKTTEDRVWSYTTYPSEPILSCAAASLLHGTGKLIRTFNTLEKMVGIGMIDIGQIGELVSRFLWLLAKDLFVRTKVKASDKTTDNGDLGFEQELQDCQLVSVVEFFKFVFGPEIWKKVPEAEGEYQNAYINFSHWVSMGRNIRRGKKELKNKKQVSIEDWTLCHWERTSAIQCCHNQPLIDKVIPMYFKGSGSKQATNISQILISDKARATTHNSALSGIQRGHQSIGPGYRGLPYIAILVDLGVKDASLKVTLDSKKKDKCLRIHAAGLGETTYPFLNDYPELRRILGDLYKRRLPSPSQGPLQALEDQMRFGWSSEEGHMNMKG